MKKSSSSKVKMEFTRQLDIFNPAKYSSSINIIGAGSVGSFIALTLAKMGLRDLSVWDHDSVDVHNLPNQFYRTYDLDRPKVDQLQDIVEDFSGVIINPHRERFNGQPLNGMVISAVDSMDTRRFIWDQIKEFSSSVPFYIDTRMGGNLMRIYPVKLLNKANRLFYERSLKPTENLLKLKCTERTIIYNVLCIAGIVGNLVTKLLKNETVPYEIIFDMKTLQFYTLQEGK